MDIEEPLVSPRHVVDQQHNELDSGSGRVQDSGVVQDYTLVRYREPRRITPLVIYAFEDLVAYALPTSFGDPSTFQESMDSQKKDKWMMLWWGRWNPWKRI